MDLSMSDYLGFYFLFICSKLLWTRIWILGLQGSSGSTRPVIFFFPFLQKKEQILLILNHKEASPSLSHSSRRDNTYLLDVFFNRYHQNTFFFFSFFVLWVKRSLQAQLSLTFSKVQKTRLFWGSESLPSAYLMDTALGLQFSTEENYKTSISSLGLDAPASILWHLHP